MILLHESGIYVFESKNYSGWIFGTETQRYWTQTLAAGRGTSQKEYFFNPIMQNEGHLKWLSKYLGKEQIPLYSYIVFSERCTLKGITLTSGRHHVIKRNDLLSAVSANAQMRPGMLTADEIDSIYLKLLPLTQVSETQKADHITNIYTKTTPRAGEKKQNTANAPGICPYCGGALKLRTAKRGAHFGEHFWGCSNYPRCRYMKRF